MSPVIGRTVSTEWRAERQSRRRRERALPGGLRADVRKVRRDDLAQEILDLIDDRVQREARRLQRVEDEITNIDVMPVVARKLLRALDHDQAFRGHIRREINRLLRSEHKVKTDPQTPATLPAVLRATPAQRHGVLPLHSSIGLGTASYLEAEPEEWCQYVVSSAVARARPPDPDRDVTLEDNMLRMFVIGAGPGGIARAVTALELPVRVEVFEQDYVLPEPSTMPCVSGTRGPSGEKHDVIAMVLASPAEGRAANHRRLYRNERAREFDLSALGLKKWLAHVAGWIAALPELMTPTGEAFVLVPASVRSGNGYQQHDALIESVTRAVSAAELQVVEQLRVVEVEPVNQPFVGKARPERWSLRLRRAAPCASAEVANA